MTEKSAFDQREEGWRADYRAQIGGLSGFRKVTPLDENHILARTIVNEDAGRYGPLDVNYDLSRQSLDTMIHHTRQDAAHAVLNTSTIWQDIRNLKRIAAAALLVGLLNLGLLLKLAGWLP